MNLKEILKENDSKYIEAVIKELQNTDDSRVACSCAEWLTIHGKPEKHGGFLLESIFPEVRRRGVMWIQNVVDFDAELLQVVVNSKHPEVVKLKKSWLDKQLDATSYHIKKTEDNIEIKYDGKNVDLDIFPENIIDLIKELPYTIEFRAQKIYTGEQWYLVVREIIAIDKQNLSKKTLGLASRKAIVNVFLERSGWNKNTIIYIEDDIEENKNEGE